MTKFPPTAAAILSFPADHPSPAELKKAFDGNASDDPDDEGSSAPSCARARDLSKQLKSLMARHAELIGRYDDELRWLVWK